MRVALLPTGRTEWHGLPGALRSLFPADPSHEFYVVPTGEEIRSNPDGFPYPGFTSTMLGERHEGPTCAGVTTRRPPTWPTCAGKYGVDWVL